MELLRRLSHFLTVVLLCAAPVCSFALVMRDSGPEPIIVQVKEYLRTSDDLDNRLAELAAIRQQNNLRAEKWWAGSKLLVLVSFPSGFTQQQAIATIRQLQQSAAVEKVVPVSAQNLEFRTDDFEREYPAGQTIPDVARRGFDKDRLHQRPNPVFDAAALSKMSHTPGRMIVRWKEEHVWKADQTGFAKQMADFHRDAGCRIVRTDRHSATELTDVLEFDDPDTLPDKLKKYTDSGLVTYAQPDFLYVPLDVPTRTPNDPVYASCGDSRGCSW